MAFVGDGDDPPSTGVNCELHRPITWRDWDSERHRVQQVLDSRRERVFSLGCGSTYLLLRN